MVSSSSGLKFEVIKKIADTRFKFKELGKVSRVDSISPPSVFIGSKLKYPLMNVGILSPLDRDEHAWMYDAEKYWADENFQIGEVVRLRDSLLNSRFQAKALDARKQDKFVELAREIGIASKQVDVEIELKKRMEFSRKKDQVVKPIGLAAPLKQAKIIGNVKVDVKLDKVMNDEIKASEGISILYKNNFDEYALNKILSVGVLGLKKNKKLVPTRWSITATDDTLGKQLIKEIKGFKWLEDYELYFGEFMGNCYLIMLFPNVWSYELFEMYFPGSSWNPSKEIKASTDYENYGGRKQYAFATAGGYYATRLAILEHLKKMKRQASVLAIRLETPTYWAALGVWVVRESVRKALRNRVLKFRSLEELKEGTKKVGMIKYAYDPKKIFNESKLLENVGTQRSLGEWF